MLPKKFLQSFQNHFYKPGNQNNQCELSNLAIRERQTAKILQQHALL
jgi:hypothetical protein